MNPPSFASSPCLQTLAHAEVNDYSFISDHHQRSRSSAFTSVGGFLKGDCERGNDQREAVFSTQGWAGIQHKDLTTAIIVNGTIAFMPAALCAFYFIVEMDAFKQIAAGI